MIPQNAGQSLTPNLKIGYQIDEALNCIQILVKLTEIINFRIIKQGKTSF